MTQAPRGSPENRPCSVTSKRAMRNDRDSSSYTVPEAIPANDRLYWTSPRRRVRHRRDATGAPTETQASFGVASPPRHANACHKAINPRGMGQSPHPETRSCSFFLTHGHSGVTAVFVRQLRGPHLSTCPLMKQAVEHRADSGDIS